MGSVEPSILFVFCLTVFCFFLLFYFCRGKQTLKLWVTKGAPLPFSFDILSAVFTYGNRAFTDYPKGIVDYFKPSFPEGYTWERTLEFEDGGVCTANVDVRYKISNFTIKNALI